jgi:hypothetical protein
MSFLYRFAITMTRKQPYIDWANSLGDGPPLAAEVARDGRTIYLVPESTDEPDRAALLDEFWERIFEQELSAWVIDNGSWPQPLTREMFDSWFDADVTSAVYDLTPDEPLTEADVEMLELDDALHRCAWCDAELGDDDGRFVAFMLADRTRLAHRAGLVVPIRLDEERIVIGVMSLADSDQARDGEDLAFRACSSRCEKALRKAVPRALRKTFALADVPEPS